MTWEQYSTNTYLHINTRRHIILNGRVPFTVVETLSFLQLQGLNECQHGEEEIVMECTDNRVKGVKKAQQTAKWKLVIQ